MYDTSNPYDWKHYKTVIYPGGRWTITDATLSPDNSMLAYSSIDSTVYVSNTSSEVGEAVALSFSAGARGNRNAMGGQFGVRKLSPPSPPLLSRPSNERTGRIILRDIWAIDMVNSIFRRRERNGCWRER